MNIITLHHYPCSLRVLDSMCVSVCDQRQCICYMIRRHTQVCTLTTHWYLVVLSRQSPQGHSEVMADLPTAADPPPGCHVEQGRDTTAIGGCQVLQQWPLYATRWRHSTRFDRVALHDIKMMKTMMKMMMRWVWWFVFFSRQHSIY